MPSSPSPTAATVIAIDGPAGSGKSTIAGGLARRLGLAHVDTGAYYRAAALAVLRAGADLDDEEAVLRAVQAVTIDRREGRTCLDGDDVEDEIRGAAVTRTVSLVSGRPAVRRHLVGLQRDAVRGGAVVEGRDAGTVVVPDARLKVWLTASPQERARRRAGQLGETDPEAIAAHAADIQRRDRLDAKQMVRADDAVEVDTTGHNIEEILDDLVARAQVKVQQ
jgi:cytidylate kinase